MEPLEGSRLVVTGAAGLIGRALRQALRDREVLLVSTVELSGSTAAELALMAERFELAWIA
ncbi:MULTISPECIES: hypothetical protein [Microbacterium]|uniref:hypothetical protein n=1 Tax=Microbacterium TaxID=33882 RepID=UPI00344F387F